MNTIFDYPRFIEQANTLNEIRTEQLIDLAKPNKNLVRTPPLSTFHNLTLARLKPLQSKQRSKQRVFLVHFEK